MFNGLLRAHAERCPDRVALRIRRRGPYEEWTYAKVWALVRSAAARLQGLGVAPGDRVALFADNSPEWALACLGIDAAGATVVPLDAQYTERELVTLLRFAETRVLLCSSSTRGKAEAVAPSTPVRRIVTIDDPQELFIAEPTDRLPPRGRGDLFALIFTSGTTGDPKAVRLTVGNILSNVEAIARLGFIGERDTLICLLPLHHCYALTTSVLAPLAAGGAVTFCTSLRGPDILEAIRETGVTVAPGVPKLFEGLDRAIYDGVRKRGPWGRRLFAALRSLSRATRLWTGWNPGRRLFPAVHRQFGPGFRFFVSGGAKLDSGVMERLLDLGVKVVEGYGLTETSPVVTFNPPRRPMPGSVGLPLPGVEVKIAAPDAAGVGEILVRGPNVMEGYDRRPGETAEVLRDGWFHTGDLGLIDSKGHLRITGRAKEVIVLASGKNIYPEEVEKHYERSALVREVCVMPVEQADGRVERLCAVVVPDFDELRRRRATSAHDEVRRDFLQLSQALPTYMRVNEVRLVRNELPRTRLGKLRRAEIRRMAFDEVARDSGAPLSVEEEQLLASPAAQALIRRLKALSGREGRIVPADHLELDLGLDSLARVELEVVLEREFGLKIPAEEAPEIETVGDLLRRLSGERGAAAEPGWGEILRKSPAPPLGGLFNLRRGPAARWSLSTLRRMALRVAQRAFPLDVAGVARLPSGRPYLLCPTHGSLMDAVLICMSLPDEHAERMFFLGAEEFFTSPFMRWVARVGRVIPTATTDTVLVSLQRAAEVLDMGYCVCIFPEGALTRDGQLQRPRPGAGILACETGVPVVPLLMRGTFDTLSYTHPRFLFTPLGLTFGEPIAPPRKPRYDGGDYSAVMQAWQRVIARLRRQDDASGGPTAGRSPRIPEDLANDE